MSIIQRVPWRVQPQTLRKLSSFAQKYEIAGAYYTAPGGRYEVTKGAFVATPVVARVAGLCPTAISYGTTAAVPGQDIGAIWYAQIVLDNASHTSALSALYSSENYNNNHQIYIGWDDYSTNVLRFSFKYGGTAAISLQPSLAAATRVANIAMYADAVEVTAFVDGVEVLTTAQTATLPATHYKFIGSSSGAHVSYYGQPNGSRGTTCAGSLFGDKRLAKRLSENPWQILAPQERHIWVPSAATPPSGFLAAWARNRSHVIGAGAR